MVKDEIYRVNQCYVREYACWAIKHVFLVAIGQHDLSS
jgi:hypothetical protein